MKKRNVFIALVMTMVFLLSACGSGNSLVGKWTGSLDLTNQIVQNMVASNAATEKYAKFENLKFTFVFEFTETEASVRIDEASTQQFIDNIKKGVADTVDAMVAGVAADNNRTVEEVYSGMGVTRDAYVQSVIEAMELETMVQTMVASMELKGKYEADGEAILILYDDNTYEEMKYNLGMEDLTITVSDGTNDYQIHCTKTK